LQKYFRAVDFTAYRQGCGRTGKSLLAGLCTAYRLEAGLSMCIKENHETIA